MLSFKQMEKVYEMLNNKEQTLQKISEMFHTIFNDGTNIFKACYALSNLLILNLLTTQQRITAIFLLLDNYKLEGIKKHPFGSTILEISNKTTQPYQRKMIEEIVLDQKRDKYAKSKVENLHQEAEIFIDYVDERPQMKKIRQEYILNLPAITSSKKSQIRNVVPDFNTIDKIIQPPEFPVNKNSINQSELSNQGFNPGFLRPIPKFIEISASEFHWLSPGIITDVHWDNTAQLQKKLAKSKALIKKAITNRLTKEQSIEVQKILDNQSYAVLNLGIAPELISGLVKKNPFIAAMFLIKMSQYPIVETYLQALEKTQLSINSLDVVIRLIKGAKIPSQFVMKYIFKIMEQAKTLPQNDEATTKLVKIIANFIKSMARNKVIDPSNYAERFMSFVNFFKDPDVESLEKIIKK